MENLHNFFETQSILNQYHQKKTLPYGMNEMFNLVKDVDSYKNFLPWIFESKTFDHHDNYFTGELTLNYKGFSKSYKSRVICERVIDECTIKTLAIDGPFKFLRSTWVIKHISEKQCELDFFVEFQFSNRLYEKLFLNIFEMTTLQTMDAFETQAQTLYKKK